MKTIFPAYQTFGTQASPKVKKDVLDGNSVAAYVAYAFSENSFIYPISPSSPMGDKMDQFSSG
jgi:pyruvate/2-oxoacid:ferredoxin oxidoreductase alpha subunit